MDPKCSHMYLYKTEERDLIHRGKGEDRAESNFKMLTLVSWRITSGEGAGEDGGKGTGNKKHNW